MNLALPDIEPAKPVSYDEPIDRAGAAFQVAANKAADDLLEMDKAEVVVQTTEAALQTTKGLNDALNFQKNNPYVTPEQVKTFFGGKPPEGITLDEDVAGPDGKTTRQPRKVIPMHEVAPYLFDRQSAAVLENAARNVKESPWRAKFKQAAERDIEQARSEMMDWQRAQRLADMEVRTLAQLEQAAAARNWNLYQTILDTPANHLGVLQREKLRAALPRLRTEAAVLDRLRGAQTVEEIDSLISDVGANRAGDKAPFAAPLSVEQQYQYAGQAKQRKHEIIDELLAAEKERKERRYQEIARGLSDAIKLHEETGRPVSNFFRMGDVDTSRTTGIDFEKFLTLENAYKAANDDKRETEWATYNTLARMTPEALRAIDVYDYLPKLAPTEFKEVEGWWRAAVEGTSKAPVIPEHIDNSIGAYIQSVLGIDPKDAKKLNEYNLKKATLGRRYLEWKKQNPDKTFLYDDVGPLALGAFTGAKKSKDAATNIAVAAVNAQGKPVTEEEVEEFLDGMDEEASLVDDAWKYVSDEDIDDDMRAGIHADLVIPERREFLQGQLRANGLGAYVEDKRMLIRRAVQNHAPAQSAARTARMIEEDANAQKRRELEAKREKEEAEAEAARVAAKKAKAAEYAAAPWKQRADEMEAAEKRASDKAEYARLLHEIPDPDESMSTSFKIGPPPSNEFYRTKELKRTQPDRYKAIELQYQRDRAAYETFIDAYKSGDSVAKDLAERYSLEMFGRGFEGYRQLRREGKVF